MKFFRQILVFVGQQFWLRRKIIMIRKKRLLNIFACLTKKYFLIFKMACWVFLNDWNASVFIFSQFFKSIAFMVFKFFTFLLILDFQYFMSRRSLCMKCHLWGSFSSNWFVLDFQKTMLNKLSVLVNKFKYQGHRTKSEYAKVQWKCLHSRRE